MPEPVKIAFRCFSDIKDPRTYEERDESLLLLAWHSTSLNPHFNFTEWWKISEGEELSGPFNVGDELVAVVLQVLERVSAFMFIYAPYSTRYRGWRA